ncbi:hypothetical protein [Saccharobesus litoralis]|uniref:hypothetical protein n=1 Tax=Saccharobesus litoralis TaxID=2172099 RepID=UPI00131EF7D1|nr:hypothetical protein [Saccharobesus litoralis]
MIYLAIGFVLGISLFIFEENVVDSFGYYAAIIVIVVIGVSILWLPFAIMLVAAEIKSKFKPKKKPVPPPVKNCFFSTYSIKEIERNHLVEDPLKACPKLPFGFLNDKWKRFSAHLSSDSLVLFERYDGKGNITRGYAEVLPDLSVKCFVFELE